MKRNSEFANFKSSYSSTACTSTATLSSAPGAQFRVAFDAHCSLKSLLIVWLMTFLCVLVFGGVSVSNAQSWRDLAWRDLDPGFEPLFDSAHSIAAKGSVSSGKILVSKFTLDYQIEGLIRNQLFYTIGQLNGWDGVADMSRVKILSLKRISLSSSFDEVLYSAELFVAWPRKRQLPFRVALILPNRGDASGLSDFYKLYASDVYSQKKCLASEVENLREEIFWYYYRPEKSSCALRKEEGALAFRFDLDLTLSEENTTGKYPEYEKIWEDGKLVVTAIFGIADLEKLEQRDPGVAAYVSFYKDLSKKFGKPLFSSLPTTRSPGVQNPYIEMHFKTSKNQLIEVHIFLVEDIKNVDARFRQLYNKLTQISDFISYSGHSGLGENIRALANMGTFRQGQYQIFLINGCDTFAYVDAALSEAHARVNPSSGIDKYIDIITNAMPSYFHMNSRSNMAVINALVESKKTYRQILSNFDPYQKAVVTGEQDNRWPEPFYGQ